jgi:predicted DNA-binding transcriptional regulator YafY
LRFAPRAARWVSTQSWHSAQRARLEPDGSYVLEIPYADDRELVMEILRFGDEVEVVGPEELRKKIKDKLAAALGRYA